MLPCRISPLAAKFRKNSKTSVWTSGGMALVAALATFPKFESCQNRAPRLRNLSPSQGVRPSSFCWCLPAACVFQGVFYFMFTCGGIWGKRFGDPQSRIGDPRKPDWGSPNEFPGIARSPQKPDRGSQIRLNRFPQITPN